MADTTLTDTPGWPEFVVPDVGTVKAATAPGAVRPGFQAAADRTAALLRGLHNPVRAYSETTGIVNLNYLGWIGLQNSTGVWTALNHNAATPFDIVANQGGSLTPDTMYFIYAYENAGVIAFTASITAPTAELLYKYDGVSAPDPKYAFITTVFADDAGNPLKFTHTGRKYMYTDRTNDGGGTDGNLTLDAGHATVQTTISFVGALPSYALTAYLNISLLADSVAGTMQVGPAGYVYPMAEIFADPAAGTTAAIVVPLPVGNGNFDYKLDDSGNDAFAWIAGFEY